MFKEFYSDYYAVFSIISLIALFGGAFLVAVLVSLESPYEREVRKSNKLFKHFDFNSLFKKNK